MERKPELVKKKALGKGLSALLPAGPSPAASASADAGFQRIPVDRIRPNPFQPRKTFSGDELHDLVESIREKGVLQPILVRPVGQGFELVAGERRLRAAQAAGLDVIPSVVRKMTDRESLEAAVIENLQRDDLNAIELGEAYHRLMHDFSMTQEDVARRVGKERATVANTMRLLKLPADVKQAVVEGTLSAGHARALLGAPPERIPALFLATVGKGLSVREVERLCQETPKRKTTRQKEGSADVHVRDLEVRLSRLGGTKVRIVGDARKGHFEVSYYSEGEFERLCQMLFGGR
ncbi:MAG TPA: ParB/RepB/Spo0J family partition protein [Candidatus Deferrimicrobiaceae bacterium]|jgi:ParB family chromosome partitioning protein